MTTLEKVILNERGERMRVAPCSKPEHIHRFQEGYIVISCGKCVLEIIDPRPSSTRSEEGTRG